MIFISLKQLKLFCNPFLEAERVNIYTKRMQTDARMCLFNEFGSKNTVLIYASFSTKL
jgi:hypothetical protein